MFASLVIILLCYLFLCNVQQINLLFLLKTIDWIIMTQYLLDYYKSKPFLYIILCPLTFPQLTPSTNLKQFID